MPRIIPRAETSLTKEALGLARYGVCVALSNIGEFALRGSPLARTRGVLGSRNVADFEGLLELADIFKIEPLGLSVR